MPSFLNKVFGRKKDEKEASPHAANSGRRLSAPPSLLEGKYEAVSPNVSPSATHFPDVPPQAAKESPLALFRSRSRQRDQPRSSNPVPAPLLTLNLPVPKEEKGQALGVVFEADPESSGLLSDAVIGDRRLNPLEALLLVKTCSGVIVDRGGLETLGLMHPHWHSSSAEVQRKLISLFILSLGSKTPITTLAPPPTSPSHLFEAELSYARSLHDIASVLRWGIRHLRLEGSSFGRQGSAGAEWAWYSSFAASERDQNYPSAAFSQVLVPLLPPSHFQLLSAVLDIIESLAAHAEANGASGSKLAKVLGLWLLSYERAKPDEDWARFYKRWEQAGRILEHIFLAHVREESMTNRMPLRLSELVKHYPYQNAKAEDRTDGVFLLPIPRFSTRRQDALFIRINSVLPTPTSSRPPKESPLRLLAEAFKATTSADTTITEDARAVWEEIKAKATVHESSDSELSKSISKVLEDETVRLLTSVSAGPESALPSPTFLISPPPLPAQLTQRSRSASSPAEGATAGTNGAAAAPSPSLTNWADFSMIGFGESNLDNNLASTLSRSEIEITQPPPTPPQKKRKVSPPADRRASADSPVSRLKTEEPKLPTTLAQVSMVQVDEAFFDFWSDTLLDPIAANWPSFIVCQLKSVSPKANLLVIEHSYTRPSPPPLPPSPTSVPESSKRASSPRPSVSASIGGRKSFAFSPTIKRFSFFSTSHGHGPSAETTKHGKKASNKASAKSPRIGEMGEILPEEDEKPSPAPKSGPAPAPKGDKPVQGLGITAAPEPAAPAVTKAEAELPPVPLVEAELPAVPNDTVAPIATELIRTESDAPGKPVVAVPEEVFMPKDEGVAEAEQAADTEKVLPPAPEGVVLTGSTPGPEVALASSEPVALAQASEAQPEPTAEAPAGSEAIREPEPESTTEPVLAAEPEPQPTPEVAAEPYSMPVEEPKSVPPPESEEKLDEAVVEDVPVSVQPEEPIVAPAREPEPVQPADEAVIAKPVELMVEEVVQEAPTSTFSQDVSSQDVEEEKEPEVEAAQGVAVLDAPVEILEASAEPAPKEVSETAVPAEVVTTPSESVPEGVSVPAEPAPAVFAKDVGDEKTQPEVTQSKPEPHAEEPAQEALKESETAAPAAVEEKGEEVAPVAEKEEEGSEESGESPGATTPTVETAEAGTTQPGNSKKSRKQKRNRRQK